MLLISFVGTPPRGVLPSVLFRRDNNDLDRQDGPPQYGET